MGFDLERKPGQETLCFSRVKWWQPAMKGTSCVCVRRVRVRPRLGVARTVMAASMCFAYSCTLQLHGVVESLLAKRIKTHCNGCMNVAWGLI